MRLNRFFIILIILVFTDSIPSYPQESMVISGIVTTFNRFPLNNVLIKSLKTGTTDQSDSLGHFRIICAEKDVLIFSASGFDEKSVSIRKSQNLSIDLVYSNTRSSFDGAVRNNHISREELQKGLTMRGSRGVKDYSKYHNIYELINNEIINVKVSGTSVTTTKVISFSLSPQVMYVVDDMVVADISFVLPSEIKTIEFLDGVSASIYGSSGANGVLKITLKGKQ